MSRLVFLLEEPSMKVFLDGLLPRLFPDLKFLCIQHEGKGDLRASLPRKLRAWREPGVRFVVLQDNDGGNCVALKEGLRRLCEENGRGDVKIRIACQELEAWYLGEPEALAEAYGDEDLRGLGQKARFRDPDSVRKPSEEVKRLVPGFQKVSGARLMSGYVSKDRNASHSFRVLLEAIEAERLRMTAREDGAC
jgi:hypothetical protein